MSKHTPGPVKDQVQEVIDFVQYAIEERQYLAGGRAMSEPKEPQQNCEECQCQECRNTDCPAPCKAEYPCDAPVTVCPEREEE